MASFLNRNILWKPHYAGSTLNLAFTEKRCKSEKKSKEMSR